MGNLRAFLLFLLGWWAIIAVAAASSDVPITLSRIGDLDVPAAEVVAGRHDANAIALHAPIIQPTARVGGWWRVDVARDLPAVPLQALVIDAPNHTETSVWLPGRLAPQVRATTGADADPSFGPRLAVFELPDGLRAGQHVYVHLQATARYPDAVRIMDARALRMRDRRDMQLNTLIAGTLLALTLVGIGMGLMLRESDFLLLGFGLAFALGFLLDSTAELYRLPGLAPLAGFRLVQRFLATGAAIYMALFVLRYLRMAERTPLLARMQWGMIWVYVLVAAGSCLPAIGTLPLWSLIGNLTMVVSSGIEVTSATKGAIKGDRASRMFLWSWAPLFVCLAFRVRELSMGLPANEMLQFAFPASFVLAGVLMMIGLCDRMLTYKRERDASDLLARRDPLTEVYNRRALDERLHAAALETGQNDAPLALLFIDLDYFKRINDEHGHDVGDECLREVARRLRVILRFGDVLGRYGGEEFVVGLPHTPLDAARALAERARHAVGSRPIACKDIEVSVTISIGVSMSHDGLAGFDAAIRRADRALYVSKRDGRDRVSAL
jgi:diguanylate cyclase (GGDEF)-like protein